MFNSLVMIAALAVGADGYNSENSREPERVLVQSDGSDSENSRETDRVLVQPKRFRSENSRETERFVVQLVSERGAADTAVALTSNATSAGSEQGSTLKLEDETVYFSDECECCEIPHGVFGFHHRFYPSPCHSPGNMTQHLPYVAAPKNYYYFRPYNWFHILDQQKEVALYGGDPRHPYANDLFEEVYQQIEADTQ